MNAILEEILTTNRVLSPDGSSVPLDYHISAAEGRALQELIHARRPRVTLEVGFAYGISTLYICEALAAAGGDRHIVIDPLQDDGWHGIGRYTVARAGYSQLVDVFAAPSHQVLPALDLQGQRIDLALIDGWHTFDYAMVDFFYIDRLLNPAGVLMLDDTEFYPALRKLARYIATHRHYRPLAVSAPRRVSMKRRVFNMVAASLRLQPLRPVMRHLVRAEVLRPDQTIGLPPDNFIVFEKTDEDRLGDGSGGTRRWDQHVDF